MLAAASDVVVPHRIASPPGGGQALDQLDPPKLSKLRKLLRFSKQRVELAWEKRGFRFLTDRAYDLQAVAGLPKRRNQLESSRETGIDYQQVDGDSMTADQFEGGRNVLGRNGSQTHRIDRLAEPEDKRQI